MLDLAPPRSYRAFGSATSTRQIDFSSTAKEVLIYSFSEIHNLKNQGLATRIEPKNRLNQRFPKTYFGLSVA
jgi:hypothetical protein